MNHLSVSELLQHLRTTKSSRHRAQEAVPGLIAALDDPEESMREAARRALAAIDPQSSAPPSQKGNQTS
jgi:HEAT repeat protein